MKVLFGILLMLIGVVFGLWAGLWWAFIGGIVDVIREILAPDLNALNIGIGIAKIFFAGLIGWAAAAIALVPGYAIVKSA